MTPRVLALCATWCAVALGALAARAEGFLAWALVVALIGGLLAPRSGSLRVEALAALVLAGLVAAVLSLRFGGVPTPWWSAGLLAGLHLLARAFGSWRPATSRCLAPWCAALFVFATGLPHLFGSAPGAFARVNPRLGAALLDAVPTSLVVESAGLDWMRHPCVYSPAGTDWFSDRRAPYRGSLAAVAALVVGCTAAAAANRRRAMTPEQR